MQPAEPSSARSAWGVAALLLAAADALAARFASVTVRGELSGFTRASSGHCYFSLKDSDGAAALVRCAMFRRAAALMSAEPRDGQQVEVRGRIALYEPRGELQLVVEAMRPLGAGSLYEEFLRLRARLEGQGLFDPARKRPIQPLPRRLAVVTSPTAAAWQDVMTALARRAPHVEVVLVPSPVQGADAVPTLVRCVQVAGQLEGVDTVLVVRGGGSIEDLWAFNDERVVRAIAACGRPVICGVGHESDLTLSDLAADLRAPTPTAAAEMAALPLADWMDRLLVARRRLAQAVRMRLDRQSQRLDLAALQLGPAAAAVAAQQARLAGLDARLRQAVSADAPRRLQALHDRSARLERAVQATRTLAANRLQSAADRLRALDPGAVLRRGYAWVEDGQGTPITRVAAVAPGDTVRAVWADGRATARVESVQPAEGTNPAAVSGPQGRT